MNDSLDPKPGQMALGPGVLTWVLVALHAAKLAHGCAPGTRPGLDCIGMPAEVREACEQLRAMGLAKIMGVVARRRGLPSTFNAYVITPAGEEQANRRR